MYVGILFNKYASSEIYSILQMVYYIFFVNYLYCVKVHFSREFLNMQPF